jgi:glycosyltransferase involved in cell wall biosynthesis
MIDIAHQAPSLKRLEGGLRTRGVFCKKSVPGKPLVTVVTVVRNGGHLLERTIQSVLEQSYDNIEYIIIDGASTDGTIDIIRNYEHSLAYWISEPDKGLYDAMNKGAGLSSGDWINFMNAGDVFYRPDSVQTVMNCKDDHDDLVYGHCQMIYDQKFSVIWKTKKVTDLWKGMICRHQSLFTRASVFKKIPFDLQFKIGADFAFIFSCYQYGCRFHNLDLVVASVTLGGLSDVNIVLAMQENLRAVMQFTNTMKIKLYYGWVIVLTYVKLRIKKIMPGRMLRKARASKYR